MEIIVTGILLAIGFYIAPLVLGLIVAGAGAIGYGICRLFGGCK
jgi:hypothetical protein